MTGDSDLVARTIRTRALRCITRARDGRVITGYGPKRIGPAQEASLLAYAATLDDEEILDWRNTGPAILRWIREHQPSVEKSPVCSSCGQVLPR